jgi:hypothetical protein
MTDHIFYISQILEKKWKYNHTVHQLFIDFGIPRKLVRLIKMCFNETYSTIPIGKNLSDKCPIQNGVKQGDTLSPLLFNYAL